MNTSSSPIPLRREPAEEPEAALPLDVVQRRPDIAPKPRSRFLTWLTFLVLAVTGAYLATSYLPDYLPENLRQRLPWQAMERAPQEQPTAAVPPETVPVFGLGRLVPEGNIVNVALPFGAGDARIARLDVKEGDLVAAGQILAVLDSESVLKAAIEAQSADVAVQLTVVEQVRQASLASRAETVATLESAKTALETARSDYDRTAGLVRKGVVARAVLDERKSALSTAIGNVERAQATLTRYDEAKDSGRQDIRVAEMRLAASRANLRRTETELEKAYIRAPVTGTIISLENQVGEKPSTSGFATMANLERMTAEIEVYQNAIGRVTVGSAVELSSDALPDRLSGRVTRIGLQVEKQNVVDSSPAANTDARVVKVYVAIDEESTAIARRFTDMQVTARISPAAPAP